jgi:hypothetical protein
MVAEYEDTGRKGGDDAWRLGERRFSVLVGS